MKARFLLPRVGNTTTDHLLAGAIGVIGMGVGWSPARSAEEFVAAQGGSPSDELRAAIAAILLDAGV